MRLLPLFALTAFIVIDLLANFHLINSETVSEEIWALGWPGRISVGLVLIGLFGHLVLKFPYGPA